MHDRHRTPGGVPRYDLTTPLIPCRDAILAGVERLLARGDFVLGEEVRALETEIAAACDAADAVGVASGSDALLLALQVAGVEPGVEVVTTPFTFAATAEAVIRLGGTPVLADIDPATLNLDPGRAADAVGDRTGVLLPVHLFGAPCAMGPLTALAEDRGLVLVEDLCQAFGAFGEGRPCGGFGRFGALSFYPTKNLPGWGDGGMILCRDADDAERLRRLRNHGAVTLGERVLPGWNSRLDEIQALVIRIRLGRFHDEQADRDRTAAIYDALIPADFRPAAPAPASGTRWSRHQYWIRCPDRGRLAAELRAQGIETGIYYDPPLHRTDLARFCRVSGDLRHAERAGDEILALPIHPALADDDAVRIGTLVRDVLTGR